MTDFAPAEIAARVAAAQAAIAERGMEAIWLNTEAEVRYYTGFRTAFWQSPTRPWHLILRADADPIAVIPEIGAPLMALAGLSDIRTWPSPRPDDEGVSLLIDALRPFARIGAPVGPESACRMSLTDRAAVIAGAGVEVVDAQPLLLALRSVKSPAEIALIRRACDASSAAFDRAPELFHEGQPLADAFRAFRIALLQAGAEEVPYLVGAAAKGGYEDVISPASPAPLTTGDVLMLDTGSTVGGYFCDFDRNFAIGEASAEARATHAALWRATEAGLAAARPGATCADLFAAMAAELPQTGGGVGRFGHGLGSELTEWPSVAPWEQTVLKPGMVMTLEPSAPVAGGRPGAMMVHEENIVITETGCELLTRRAPADLPVLA